MAPRPREKGWWREVRHQQRQDSAIACDSDCAYCQLDNDPVHVEPPMKRRKMNETSSEESEKAKPTLLSLPAELRNRIYEFVLLLEDGTPGIVDIYDEPDQPALLKVNHQIRDEAMSIFYQNYFELSVHDLQPAPVQHHWCWDAGLDEIEIAGNWPWSNLKDTLKRVHNGNDRAAKTCAELVKAELYIVCDNYSLLAHNFRLLEIMKEDPWEKVEKVLEIYNDIMEGWYD